MGDNSTHRPAAVTGAFSYTGSYIARSLIDAGQSVRGLVRTIPADPGPIDCRPLQFTDADRLKRDLEGVDTLYNTYWIRFNRGHATFDSAVRNIEVLATAARAAGVRRMVHISVSNPSLDSPFAYFRGKARAEGAVVEAGPPSSIVRPTLVFGKEDILIHNIAFLLRRLHVFAVPGDGRYRVQPVSVRDVASLALSEATTSGHRVLDAAGPETFTFRELIRTLADAIGARAMIVPAPRSVVLAGSVGLNLLLRDVVITNEELGALMEETLISSRPSLATTSLRQWLIRNGSNLGRQYHSELHRHWKS